MNLDLLKLGYWDEAGDDGDGGGGTADDGGGAGGEGSANGFSDTWREDYAGEDESKLAQLSRYASPNAAFDGLISAKQKISSGEFKSTVPFPTDGDETAQAEWRESNGIPATADKYEISLSGDRTISDADKPFADEFLAAAHSSNMSPAHANAALDFYYNNLDKQAEAREEADQVLKQSTEDALRAEWGNEYRANVNRIHGFLDGAPEGVKENFMDARYPDGTPVASDPDTLKWLVGMSVQLNPASTLVPGAGDNIKGAVGDEIKTIENLMGNKQSEYWKGPMHANGQDTVMQFRYKELVTAQEKMK